MTIYQKFHQKVNVNNKLGFIGFQLFIFHQTILEILQIFDPFKLLII